MINKDKEKSRRIGKTAAKHLIIVFGMFGFGFAMVPMYDIICDVTGLNGKTGRTRAEVAEKIKVDESREITVEFLGIINGGGWEFKPVKTSMVVHPGKMYSTHFFAKNLRNESRVAQAVPSVAPSTAAKYFSKTECFCFTRQEFAAGSGREMPLVFIIDPDMPKNIEVLTLSYTFFNVESETEG